MTEGSPDVRDGWTRRRFVKAVIVASIAAEAASLLDIFKFGVAPASGVQQFLKLQLVDLNGNPVKAADLPLDSSTIVTFPYPLSNEVNLLMRLPTANATGGVGPNHEIVAFSGICQHLGCEPPSMRYYPSGTVPPGVTGYTATTWKGYVFCGCHGSIYDPANAAAVLAPPAPRALPQVVMEWDSATDYLYVLKVIGPTIYGHDSDLTGGNPLPAASGQTEPTTTAVTETTPTG